MLIAAVIAARFGVAAERKPLESVARPLAAAVAQPGSIVQETAAEIDQGIAAAARDDVDHPADDDSGSKMVDGLLQHAIDRADGVIEDRRARGQRAPATGLEASSAFGRRLAGEHVGDRPRVAAEIVDREVVAVQHGGERRCLAVD